MLAWPSGRAGILRRMTRRTCLAIVAAGLCAAGASPASAQRGGASGGPGFAVAAAGVESYFKYRLEPGDRRSGRLRLISRSGRREVVVLKAADVATAATGGLEYGSGRPRGVGAWIKLSRARVALPPGAAVEVPFSLRVPEDADAGDHLAGLVAVNRRHLRAARRDAGKERFSLRFLPRLAIAVQTTVPGPAPSELAVGNIGIEVRPTTTDVTVLVRNTGRTLISETKGRLTVTRGDRVLLRRRVDLDAFVPGPEILYRLPLTGVPARGSYQVSGRLLPAEAPPVTVEGEASFEDEEAEALEEQTGRRPIDTGPSTLLVVAIVAGVLALVIMGVALVVLRRRLAEARSRGDADA